MTKQACPKCGMIHKAPKPITIFGCCHVPATKKLGAENVYVRTAKPYQPPPPKPDTTNEPGSVLYRILRDVFQVKPKPGCGCHELRDEMNALGVDGCERECDRLVDRLKENAKAYKWLESFGAALNAVRNGALGWLDPFRPWESILRHAIETSRELKAVADADLDAKEAKPKRK